MFEIQHDLPFATLQISINGIAMQIGVGEMNKALPILADGMRIDGCQIGTFSGDILAGEIFSISLVAEPFECWVPSVESGELLGAIVFTHSSGAVGALAMRDADWFCQRYPLEQLDDAHSIGSTAGFSTNFRATAPAKINIQTAFAWLMKPETAQEALAPWFAVDKALRL